MLRAAEKNPCCCLAQRDRSRGPPGRNLGCFDGVIVSMATWFLPSRAQLTPCPAHPPLTSYRQDAVVTICDSVTAGTMNPPLLWRKQLTTSCRRNEAFLPLPEILLPSREPLHSTQQDVLHSACSGHSLRPCTHPDKTPSPCSSCVKFAGQIHIQPNAHLVHSTT